MSVTAVPDERVSLLNPVRDLQTLSPCVGRDMSKVLKTLLKLAALGFGLVIMCSLLGIGSTGFVDPTVTINFVGYTNSPAGERFAKLRIDNLGPH